MDFTYGQFNLNYPNIEIKNDFVLDYDCYTSSLTDSDDLIKIFEEMNIIKLLFNDGIGKELRLVRMNRTVTHYIAENSFKTPRISNRLKVADKLKNNENTALSTKYAKVNYDDFLQKSNELELFLNSTFNVESKREDLISFIINNNLLDIIKELPSNLKEYFDTSNLEIHLENKWIDVKVFTKLDGESASNKLDLIEDKLFEKYQDDFLDNILLSVKFE